MTDDSVPSAGWRAVAGSMGDRRPGKPHDLPDYIDENREDLEAIAEGQYAVSPVVQALLDKADRGEV